MKKKIVYVFLFICCWSLLSSARQLSSVSDHHCCNDRKKKEIMDAGTKDHKPVETDISFFNLLPFNI